MKNSESKEIFINAVLEMLDEGVPLHEISLRSLARRLNCAHTNAYNWFSSQEELYWWAFAEAIKRLTQSAGGANPENLPGPFEKNNPVELYIAFTHEHPAWFRLIWMDTLSGTPPEEVQNGMLNVSQVMEDWFYFHAPVQMKKAAVAKRIQILYAFLQGELSLLAAGRSRSGEAPLNTADISARFRALYRLLFASALRKKSVGKKEKK